MEEENELYMYMLDGECTKDEAFEHILAEKLKEGQDSVIDAWNAYCDDNRYDDKIWPMDEDMINDMLSSGNPKPLEIFLKGYDAKCRFSLSDKYVWFDDDCCPSSGDSIEDSMFDLESLTAWLKQSPAQIEYTDDEETYMRNEFIAWALKCVGNGMMEPWNGMDIAALQHALRERTESYEIYDYMTNDWEELYAEMGEE